METFRYTLCRRARNLNPITTYSPNLLSAGAFVSAFLTASLAAIAATRRKVRAAMPFAAMMVCLALYCFGFGFESMSPTVGAALFWTHVEYLGISFIPAVLVLFGMDFASVSLRYRRFVVAPLLAPSMLTLIMQETAQLHHLFYLNLHLRVDGPIRGLAFDGGPFYAVGQIYLTGAMLATAFLVSRHLLRSSGVRRTQDIIVVAGLLVAVLGYALYIAGLTPHRLDMNPLFLALSASLFAYGLFRYRMLNFTPIAHVRAFEAMGEGGIILDNENCLVDFNETAHRIFAQLSNERLGEAIERVLADESELVELARSGGHRRTELFVTVEGIIRCYNVAFSPVTSRRGRTLGTVIILNDTTRQFELARELKELAIRDPLTQLFSRRHFFEVAATEIERARRGKRPAAVIMVDLDHFKKVNDSLGHQAGDLVLVETAARFRKALRTSDIICRYGGEEFVVFLPETDVAAAHSVADRLRTVVASGGIAVGNGEVPVTGSFGVSALSATMSESIDDLVRAADEALYRAKQSGRNRVEISRTI